MNDKRCDTCLFWHEIPPEGEANNECRRCAPLPGSGRQAVWPKTKARDFCGEWKKKAAK